MTEIPRRLDSIDPRYVENLGKQYDNMCNSSQNILPDNKSPKARTINIVHSTVSGSFAKSQMASFNSNESFTAISRLFQENIQNTL